MGTNLVVSAPTEGHEATSVKGDSRNEAVGVSEVGTDALEGLVQLISLPEGSARLTRLRWGWWRNERKEEDQEDGEEAKGEGGGSMEWSGPGWQGCHQG